MCKVGFPLLSIEKYTELIEKTDYSYIVYFFNQQTEELEVIKEFVGTKENKIKDKRQNCYICKHSTKSYLKPDKYIQAVARLYEKEFEENGEEDE